MLPEKLPNGNLIVPRVEHAEDGSRYYLQDEVKPGTPEYERNLPFVRKPPEQANLSMEAPRTLTAAEHMAAELNEQLNRRAGQALAGRFRD